MSHKTQQKITKNELLNLFEKSAGRIDLLAEKEKAIVRLFMSSQKFTTLAKSAAVSEASIARRLKKIARLISRDDFITALTENNSLPIEEMRIIKDYFVNGTTIKAIIKKTGLSRYKIKKIINQMRNL
jgi:DNA invertase Pin-like site-specific DNA recombinase